MSQALSSAAHAAVTLKHLRRLCYQDSPQFELVRQTATTLGQERALNLPSKSKVKPDWRTIVATTLGAPSFNEIAPLVEHEYDERIRPESLADRRCCQTSRLAELLTKKAEEHDLPTPSDMASYAINIINEWQPTALPPEVKVSRANEMHEDLLQHFALAQLRMQFAAHSELDLRAEDIEDACTVLNKLDPGKLMTQFERVRHTMMVHMCIVAERMAYSGS
jgi:hypothetical protein